MSSHCESLAPEEHIAVAERSNAETSDATLLDSIAMCWGGVSGEVVGWGGGVERERVGWGTGEGGSSAGLDARATFRWPAASSIYTYSTTSHLIW